MSKKADYDMQYMRENVVRKFIPFNRRVAFDVEMLDFLATKANVTQYIKSLIRNDMLKEVHHDSSEHERR